MTNFLFIKADSTHFLDRNAIFIDVVTQTADIAIDRAWWGKQLIANKSDFPSEYCNSEIQKLDARQKGIFDELEQWLLDNRYTTNQILTLQDEVAMQAMELEPSLKVLKDAQEVARFSLYQISNDFFKDNIKER